MQSNEHEQPPSGGYKYFRYYHIGVQFILGVGLFTFGGIWLDGKLGTRVLFTLLGLFLGFAGSLRSIYGEIYGGRASARKTHGEGEMGEGASGRGEKAREDPEESGPGSG